MFRKVNLKDNKKSKDKIILMKNSREEFCEIPIEYINEITYEFMQPDVMTLTIPNKTTHNGQTVYNHVFDKILGKRQQIKFNDYTYVVTECDRNDEKNKKIKNITAKSYDVTLEDSFLYTPMGGMMRHLIKREGEYETADGYLDEFVKANPLWKIGHVDDSCRTEYNKVSVEQDRNINNMSFDNVGFDTVLFNQSFEGVNPVDENNTVGLRISFRNIKLYDPATNKLLNTVTKTCDLGLFHIGVKNIKAIFTTTDAYRYGINFEVTLVDGTVLSRVCEFVDIKNYNMRCSEGVLLFTDGTLKTVSMLKYRNLEENVYSWRSILVDYLTEAFDCFVVFDNKDFTINVYDKKTFGDNKGVCLSYDNFVKGINKSYQYDQIVTKLIIESEEEGLSITDENPLGTDYLLNYDYFIDNGIMSEQCAKAWKLYESRIDGVQDGLFDLRTELNTKNSLKIKLDTEILTLEESIKGLEAIRVGFVKENDTVNAQRLSKEINEKYDRVAEIVKQLATVNDELSNLKKQVQVITNSITMEEAVDDKGNKVFTQEDLLEIQSLTISETYVDKYYLTAYGLYNNSLEILKERNKLQIDFTVNTVGLLQNIIIPKGLTWDYYIKIGDKINLEDNEIEGDIRTVKIVYSPKDFKVTNITFTNKDKEVDDLKSIGNIGRTVGRIDNLANNYRVEWEKGMTTNKYIDEMLTTGLNLKSSAIRSRSYRVKTDFTESGLFVWDGLNENNGMFLAGGIICITNDKFETCKVAIDQDGVVAKQIVGELILGKKLYITSELGEFFIGNMDKNEGFGISIKDDTNYQRIFLGTEMVDGVRKARLRLYSKDGRETVLSEDGIIQTSQFLAWDNLSPSYPMRIPYVCDEGVVSNKKVLMSLIFEKYRAFERGMSSGGTVATSSSGGGGTSASGGGGTSGDGGVTSVSGGGTTSVSSGSYNNSYTQTSGAERWIGSGYTGYFMTGLSRDYNVDPIQDHYHALDASLYAHTHNVSISVSVPNHTHTIPSHTHAMPTHSHTIPNHTHEIYNHTHTLDTTHNHELEYAIHEQNSVCRNVKVFINNNLVTSGINGDTQIDITNHIVLGRTNDIRIETEANGRITCNIFTKAFVSF